MIRNIVFSPNAVLQSTANPVEHFDKKLAILIADMKATLIVQKNPEGVGLAAPQIGVPLQIFIIQPSPNKPISVFINPEVKEKEGDVISEVIKSKAKKKGLQLEGCLSVPKIWAPVGRFSRVFVTYYDIQGKKHERWFRGFTATVIQHEMDHINGVLFTQRAIEQNQTLYQENDEEELVAIKLP